MRGGVALQGRVALRGILEARQQRLAADELRAAAQPAGERENEGTSVAGLALGRVGGGERDEGYLLSSKRGLDGGYMGAW